MTLRSNPPLFFFVFLVTIGGSTSTIAQSAGSGNVAMSAKEGYFIADRGYEIALARTAAPPSIAREATILVLGARGYEMAIKGTNGFVCFVERSWAANFADADFWNPKLRAPNCFNPPAVRSELLQYLRRTQWVLDGMSKPEMIKQTKADYANHAFRTPEANAFSFMLSKQGYLGDAAGGPWLPHVMFFLLPGAATDWGTAPDSPVIKKDGNAIEPTLIFIPVRTWSDGSLASSPPARHSM